MLEHVPFSLIFKHRKVDDSLELKRDVRIGGITLAEGSRVEKGQIIAGIDLTQYVGHELGVIKDDGVYVIREIY